MPFAVFTFLPGDGARRKADTELINFDAIFSGKDKVTKFVRNNKKHQNKKAN